jgi:hypothetical protein
MRDGIFQTISAGDAISLYREYRSRIGQDVSPKFLCFWWMEETRADDGMMLGHLHPSYVSFSEWKRIRVPAGFDEMMAERN